MEPRDRTRLNRGRARGDAPAPQQQIPRARRPGPNPALEFDDVPGPCGRGSRRDLTGRDGGGKGPRESEVLTTKPRHVATKKGTQGIPITLQANHFPIISGPKWGLNQYRVDISPELEDTRIRKKLVSIGMRSKSVVCPGYIFDGTVLYTPQKIDPDPLECVVMDENNNYTIIIRVVGKVERGDQHYIQIFNIIMRKCCALMKLSLVGRYYHDPVSKVSLRKDNIELWPGYTTSLRQYEKQLMLNVDIRFKVLRLDNVIDLFLECGQNRDSRTRFIETVIGSIVMTAYNNKTYRIDDVDFNQNPLSTFVKRDGTVITYKQYFKDRYNVRITIDQQPMLVSRSKQREIRVGMPEVVILVPELCILTGLTAKQRENLGLMKSLGQYTRIPTRERMHKIIQFVNRLKNCPQAIDEVKRWDLQLADEMISLEGRVLPPETLFVKMNKAIHPSEKANWTRTLYSAPMFVTPEITELAIVVPSRLSHAAMEFSTMLQKVGDGMSMNIKCRPFIITDDRIQTYLEELELIFNARLTQMVMVILPNNSGDRYNAIKKKCFVDRAIPCQVILGQNLTRKNAMSIASNVVIQLNCKMGGAPWATKMPPHTMVCGYDVCRDTANRGNSFAGMVATQDAACSSYYSMAVEHEGEQELSNNIAGFVMMACRNYQARNSTLPERIIIYRDGVGDGQIEFVRSYEVETIKERLKREFYSDKPLKMAFIVVTKRINTKFFGSQPHSNDFNPPPGTVVDDVVTLPERYDFYLVPQCVRQGTVSPTSFNIIEDTLGVNADKIQRFTYKMCHMYYNWSGTVRVPAPCQYAHKLAFLTAQSLHRPANFELCRTLYYL